MVQEHVSPVWGCGWSLIIRGELHTGDLNGHPLMAYCLMGDLDSDIGDDNIEYAGDCTVVWLNLCCCCSSCCTVRYVC